VFVCGDDVAGWQDWTDLGVCGVFMVVHVSGNVQFSDKNQREISQVRTNNYIFSAAGSFSNALSKLSLSCSVHPLGRRNIPTAMSSLTNNNTRDNDDDTSYCSITVSSQNDNHSSPLLNIMAGRTASGFIVSPVFLNEQHEVPSNQQQLLQQQRPPEQIVIENHHSPEEPKPLDRAMLPGSIFSRAELRLQGLPIAVSSPELSKRERNCQGSNALDERNLSFEPSRGLR
jgi:hypothetical protein